MSAVHALRNKARGLLLAFVYASVAGASTPDGEQNSAATSLRWEEGQPGCTFSRDDDGKYRYGFWTADFGVVLAVDSQELEKVRGREQPIFALQLTVHYRGKNSLDVIPDKISLEFVKHYHDVHGALDPDDLAIKLKSDADSLEAETEREIRKHPEQKEEKEAALHAHQKDAAQMIEFLHDLTLPPVKLDSGHLEASGWVLFSTKSKWIDELRKQEEFLLRVPLQGRVIEFPFSLPPSEGDLILRRRPEK
jgi:hypothetical protein